MTAALILRRVVSAGALLFLIGCGSATIGGGGSRARAKWVSPIVTTPDGGQLQTTIYYGPWQCSAAFISRCESKCAAQGHALKGCIWLADIKGEFGAWPQSSTGKYWPGHHIFDLGHGGPPVAPNNVLPAPDDVHSVFNTEYPACYAPGGKWLTPGPARPYVD